MKRPKFWKRFLMITIGLPIFIFTLVIIVFYWRQDDIVDGLIKKMNTEHRGRFELKDSHISIFHDFPNLTIELDGFNVFESKEKESIRVLGMEKVFAGIDFFSVFSKQITVNHLEFEKGDIESITHIDGSNSIQNAFEKKSDKNEKDIANLEINSIEFNQISFKHRSEIDSSNYVGHINTLHADFSMLKDQVELSLKSNIGVDTVSPQNRLIFTNKLLTLGGKLHFNKKDKKLSFQGLELNLDGAKLVTDGKINLSKQMLSDINFSLEKPSFDLIFAALPHDISLMMAEYESLGQIEFRGNIKGPLVGEKLPNFYASYTCKNGSILNKSTNKKIDQINFNLELQKDDELENIHLTEFHARTEKGEVSAFFELDDFERPYYSLKFNTALDLSFLPQFAGDFNGIKGLDGQFSLSTSLEDSLIFDDPKQMINGLINNMSFHLKCKNLHIPNLEEYNDHEIDAEIHLEKNRLSVDNLSLHMKHSNISVSGNLDSIYQLIHASNPSIKSKIHIHSDKISINDWFPELTNEEVSNFDADLIISSTLSDLTSQGDLPKGAIGIKNLSFDLKNFPHHFENVSVTAEVDQNNMRLSLDAGQIDQSDFTFKGFLKDYKHIFNEKSKDTSALEFEFESDKLELNSLFTYGGTNHLPVEYQNEEINRLKIHGMTYANHLRSGDEFHIYLDQLEGKLKSHALQLKDFKGDVVYKNNTLEIRDFHGVLGKTNFTISGNYELDEDSKKRSKLSFEAKGIDVDELIGMTDQLPIKSKEFSTKSTSKQLEDFDFDALTIDIDIKHLNYHRQMLNSIKGRIRVSENRKIQIRKLSFLAAGGMVELSGNFDASKPNAIQLQSKIKVKDVDLDKLLFKFDNFGQQFVLSENISGVFTGVIDGNIQLKNDLTPILDQSELNLNMSIVDGNIRKAEFLNVLSDYFEKEELQNLQFDTLKNQFTLKKGILEIPEMKIRTNLGKLFVSGSQELTGKTNMNVKVPWQLIADAAWYKLFDKSRKRKMEKKQDLKYLDISIVKDSLQTKVSLNKVISN